MAWLFKRGKKWYIGFREGGKARSITTGTAVKKEALRKLDRFEADGGRPQTRKITLQEFTESYLLDCDSTHSPRWAKNKRLIFKNFLIPFFGADTLIKNITTKKVDLYRAERLKTISKRTVNIETNCLMSALRKAVEWGELEENQLPRVKKFQESRGRIRFLSREEIMAIREAAKAHSREMEAYVLLMLFAGLRSGEALSLRWVDVDLTQKVLYVDPRQDWRPKSGKGRVIPLPADLYEFLDDRRKEIPDAVLIVHGQTTPYMLKRRFQRVVIAANLPTSGEVAVTAHTLRHTYASYLVMRGVPLYTVSGLLGHSTVKTTEIYSHLAPDHLKMAVQGIDYQ